MKSEDILSIIDFLYYGEANVFQENLDAFLALAEELHLKGLMGKTYDKDFEEDEKPLAQTFPPTIDTDTNKTNHLFKRHTPSDQTRNPGENRTLAVPNQFSGDLVELEERVKSMMEKSQNKLASGLTFAYRCNVCGKEANGSHIKDHIERNHLEGVIIPCNFCSKTFRSRNSLKVHKLRKHQN